MAKSDFKLETLESFSGGLNLRSDQFNLGDNESPDLLNVDVDPRGGMRMRKGVDRRNTTALSADVQGMWGFHTDAGVNQLMVNYGTKVAQSASGDFTDLTGITARTDGSRVYGATMNNVAYGVSYDKPSFKWDGSTAADLGTSMDGSDGNMPQGQYIAQWNNHLWVANTYEGSTAHKNRVRWSWANQPEKWGYDSTDDSDWVDIDPGEHGDYITGLSAFGDRLLVFKTNSVYAIYGYDSDSFQSVTLSNAVGSVPLSSPAASPGGVYFWHGREGVYWYDGQRFVWLFQKLKPAIDDGRITFASAPQLAWGNNKLYVSVDWTTESGTTRRTLVFDPTIGEFGAWVLSDIDAGSLFSYRIPNGAATVMAGCVSNTGRVVALEQDRDDDRYGATTSHIDSHFVTTWLEGKNPVVKKRWGKPRMITAADTSVTLSCEVYKDYDKATVSKSFDVPITGKAGAALWDTAVWDTATWGTDDADAVASVERLPTLGTARSISMKVVGPKTSNNSWEVNALAFTYAPRRLR